MLNPDNKTDPLERYLINVANEIEINLMLEGVDWSSPKDRSGIIACIIALWESFKKGDRENGNFGKS